MNERALLAEQPAMHYTDEVFAPLDRDHQLERIAGGNETEVYRTDDQRYVVKLKSELGGSRDEALQHARVMRVAAEQFVACLGPEQSIPSFYVVSRDQQGRAQVLVMQPFVAHAQPLYHVDYAALSDQQRRDIARNLRLIIRRALAFYRATGSMPDLYGRSSASAAERQRTNGLHRLPHRLWSFLVERSLLRSHNLLLTDTPDDHVVLVDYDIVRRGRLYRRVYYAVRWLLFWRDLLLIWRMVRRGGAR
jgi:hypothetical protein